MSIGSGCGDWLTASRAATYLAGKESNSLLSISERMAAGLVRTHWRAVATVAEKLVVVGRIEGDDESVAGIERLDRSLRDGEFVHFRDLVGAN